MDRGISALGKVGVVAAALVGVALFGFLDVVLGNEISFSIFYVLPVSLAVWYAGLGTGTWIALVAAATWLAADVVGGATYSSPLIPYVNGLVRLGYFLIIVRLLSLVRKRLRFEELAHTDPLTGLANARAFLETLETERARAVRYGRGFALAYLDLDDFKGVNDSRGRAAGDRVLREVGRVLVGAIRRTDCAARLGGDEFAVLLPETDEAGAMHAFNKIGEALAATGGVGGWPVKASVGVVTFEDSPASGKAALKADDDLMYEAKRSGKNRILHRIIAGRTATPGADQS